LGGFAADRFVSEESLFELTEGELVLGDGVAGAKGFRGGVDEFKVLAHVPNVEVACNHARGTLIEVGANPAFAAVAAEHPAWAQAEVREAARGPEGARYACFHDYSDDYAAHLGNIPDGTTSVRGAINFPEGPIVYGAPRPDSSENAFCLTCHTPEGKGGLSTRALTFREGVNAEDDRRRQPLQPPRRVFGNIPAGWIPAGPGPGGPAEHVTAPPEGLVVDQWVLPQAGAKRAPGTYAHRH